VKPWATAPAVGWAEAQAKVLALGRGAAPVLALVMASVLALG